MGKKTRNVKMAAFLKEKGNKYAAPGSAEAKENLANGLCACCGRPTELKHLHSGKNVRICVFPQCPLVQYSRYKMTANPVVIEMPKDTKPTNPKDAVGIAKIPYSTLSCQAVAEVGLAMLEGARKYGRHNYRKTGVRASVYYDACRRHLDAYWEGQDIDPDSGLPHVVKAMACLMVLRDAQITGKFEDDRPPKLADDWQVELNKKAKAILEKYPNPKDAVTQKSMEAEK